MNQNNHMKEVQPKRKFRQIIGNIAFGITLIVCLFVVLFCSMGNNRKMETASADSLSQSYDVSEGFAPAYSVVGYDLINDSSGHLVTLSFYSAPFFSGYSIFYSDFLGENIIIDLLFTNVSFVEMRYHYDFSNLYYYCVFDSVETSIVRFVIYGNYLSSINGKLYFMEGEYDPSVGVPLVLQVSDVWGQIAEWFAGCFPDITQFFYVDGSLTFAGTCAVIMAGVALILLIFNLIRSFLPMRG